MGKIKSKLMRRSARVFSEEGVEFSRNFEKNKKTLKDTMPSKKMRNRMAGLMVSIKKINEKHKNSLNAPISFKGKETS